ncbi:conjugal transfer protein TraR [Candidatus Bathyarchaeota archaeon]|nr:conjugal transfer protein TraR [Candidatus Bathyarchaeota archaeon]
MVIRRPELLRSSLEEERARLLAVIAQAEAEGKTNLGYGNHMADDATEAFEQAKDLALRQNAQQLLVQVTDALARFDQGTYGICESCREPIDPARLSALPYATLCIRCQQRLKS